MTDGRSTREPSSDSASIGKAARRKRRLPDETGVAIALLILVVIVGILRPNFLQPQVLFQQLSGAAFIGMLALGMVFVVVIRDIDLSVGWMFNFSAVIAATAMVAGIDPWIAAVIGIAVRRSAGTRQRRPRGRPPYPGHHHYPWHPLGLSRLVAGRQ